MGLAGSKTQLLLAKLRLASYGGAAAGTAD